LWASIGTDNTVDYIAIKENLSMEQQFQGNNYEAVNPQNDFEDDYDVVPVDENEQLNLEGQTQLQLTQANSQHILNLVREPVQVPIPGVDDRYRVARLFMEYCPLGTIGGLLTNRKIM
jgi:Mg/Co/Ni transporter MgtE